MRLHVLTCNEEGYILTKALPKNEQTHAKEAHSWPNDHQRVVLQLPYVSCMCPHTKRYQYTAGLATAKKYFWELGVVAMEPLAAASRIQPMREFETSRANDFLLPANLVLHSTFQFPAEYRWVQFVEDPQQYRLPGKPAHYQEWLRDITTLLHYFQLEKLPAFAKT